MQTYPNTGATLAPPCVRISPAPNKPFDALPCAETHKGLSTCHISTPEENDPQGGSDALENDPPYAEYALGGEYFRLKHPNGRYHPRIRRQERGLVGPFNKRMKQRMLMTMAKVNKRRIAAPPGLITLTYPAVWSSDPAVWKGHLEAFRKRFEREWGQLPIFWRQENQRRGAPHYHLLVFMPLEVMRSSRFKLWTSLNWYQVVRSGDVKHLRAGTRVEQVRSWRGARSYMAKYLGKETPADVEHRPQGRLWGVWNKDMLPVALVCTILPSEGFYRARRAAKSLLAARGYPRNPKGRYIGMQVFMEASSASRIVAYAAGSSP